MDNAHPNCTNGHVCQKPSGRACVEHGCNQPAGTLWGPMWCPDHDRERLNRVGTQMEGLLAKTDNNSETENQDD